MSIEVLAAVLRMNVGDPTVKLVLIGLANHAHADGTAAWPTVERLGEYACCSRRTVQRSLATLKAAGHIRPGDQRLVAHLGRYASTVYDVATSEAQVQEWRGANLAPLAGAPPTAPRGATGGSSGAPVVAHKPSLNRPEPSGGDGLASVTRLSRYRTPPGPSPFCSAHPLGTEAPCGPCRGARQARAAWEALPAPPDERCPEHGTLHPVGSRCSGCVADAKVAR